MLSNAVVLLPVSEDDLQPEHREQIRKLEMCRKEIMHRQPGETVFQPGRFGCLFSFPDTLTLASCGFVPGTSFLDTQLATLPPDLPVQFLCHGTVQLDVVFVLSDFWYSSCAMEQFNWMLYLPVQFLCHGTVQLDVVFVLSDLPVQFLCHGTVQLDVVIVLSDLLACWYSSCAMEQFNWMLCLFCQTCWYSSSAMEQFNWMLYLLVQFLCSGTVQLCFHAVSCHKQFLSWTFQLLSVHRCGVEGLFTLLYDVLLMKTGKGSTWVPSVSDIIRVFVNYGASFEDLCPHPHLLSFSSEDLQYVQLHSTKEGQGDHHMAPLDAARTYGCENLQLVIQVISHALTLRPHMYSVNDLMTLTSALLKVALDVSLTEGMLAFDFQECLSAALNAFSTDDWSAKVRQLFGVMQTILSQAHTDFYQLSSLLALINLCVGSETLKAAEREDLRQLTDMLRRMIGSVREYIHVLDRTLRSLFEWTQHPSTPPQKLAVEQVQCSQDETDNETDQSEHVAADQSEDAITDADNKMPGVEVDGAGQEHSDKDNVSSNEPGHSDTTSDKMDQSEHISIPVSQSDHLCSASDHTDVGSVSTKQSGHSSHLAGHSRHSTNAADQSHCSKHVIAQSHHSNKAAGQSRSSVSNDTVSNNRADKSHHTGQSDRASKQTTEPLVSLQAASMAANV
ncbi:hypothetical protein NP493_1241g00000 [Ridgeia piscesae]|uniref:Coiled-coil SMC6 And NSE5 INteracting (CANIN) domain-containing protein n=1 Tax=Ridgeia piscesae TaxID=27915 RepID=A0AAD9KCJ3_RIDPI|nr:hypothetical protein NP493_1241g00000 [Ridgeia piscesae]